MKLQIKESFNYKVTKIFRNKYLRDKKQIGQKL